MISLLWWHPYDVQCHAIVTDMVKCWFMLVAMAITNTLIIFITNLLYLLPNDQSLQDWTACDSAGNQFCQTHHWFPPQASAAISDFKFIVCDSKSLPRFNLKLVTGVLVHLSHYHSFFRAWPVWPTLAASQAAVTNGDLHGISAGSCLCCLFRGSRGRTFILILFAGAKSKVTKRFSMSWLVWDEDLMSKHILNGAGTSRALFAFGSCPLHDDHMAGRLYILTS